MRTKLDFRFLLVQLRGILVPDVFIRPVVSVPALTWFRAKTKASTEQPKYALLYLSFTCVY
jgi:hypothetical protein